MRIFFSIILLIFLLIPKDTFAKLENQILIKVENKIITRFEVKNKIITTLILSNEEVSQENIDRLKGQALDFLIQHKLRKIELEKYNLKSDSSKLENYLNQISSNDIEGLKRKFNEYNLDYDLFKDEIDTQLKWQSLIYNIYSNKIDIDENIINKEIETILKNKKDIEEFKLSQIEILLDENTQSDKKIKFLEKQIRIDGFDKTAIKYNNSSGQNNNLGWINAKSLSKSIYSIIKNMKIGEISKPIKTQNSILFLKLEDKRISKTEDFNKNELKKNLLIQKKNELFNLYSKSHLSKLKNTSLIEYIK